MKTLKKSLCLILALVFVLGLCTIGAGAAFTDAEEITYVEAVNAMADLGILEGPGDGAYHPTDLVTRAEAAKMIAYMCLGSVNAERLVAGESFTDVPEDYWAAKYIGFCAKKGYIVGDGDGTFRPKDLVKGSELAVMLLRSVGYGEMGEYVGKGWDLNAVVDALDLGIYEGSDADFSAYATREECALYVYNTMMDVDLVSYDVDVNVYEDRGITYAEKVWGFTPYYVLITANQATGATATLGYELDATGAIANAYTAAPDTTLAYVTGADMIGHVARVLENANKHKVYSVSDASLVYDAGTKFVATQSAGAITFVNYAANSAQAGAYDAAKQTADMNAVVFNGKIYSFLKEEFYIGKAELDSKTGAIKLNGTTFPAGFYTAYEGIKNGDIVEYVTVGNLATISALTAETVYVSQRYDQKVTYTPYYSYNYNTYVASKAANMADVKNIATGLYADSALEPATSYVFYLDHNGNYVYATAVGPVTTAKNYVYYVASYSKVDDFGTPSYFAQCVTTEGEVISYPIASLFTGAKGVYELKVSTTAIGKYDLATATNIYVDGEDRAYAAAATKFVGVPYYIASDVNVITVTGEKATLKVSVADALIGSYHADKVIGILTAVYGSAASEVHTVFVTEAPAAAPTQQTGDLIYVLDTDVTATGKLEIADGYKTVVPTYTFFVDGERKSDVPVTGAVAAGFYSSTIDNYGVYTLTALDSNKVDTISDFVIYNGILTGATIASDYDGQNFSGYTFKNLDTGFFAADVSTTDAIAKLIKDGKSVTLIFACGKDALGNKVPVGVIYVQVG